MTNSEKMRLQKFLSRAGHSSRRKAESLIKEGRVTVNGTIVTELGTQVRPEHSKVEVDGKAIRWRPERLYILLNKPRGYLTSLSDPTDRPLVIDLLPKGMPRVYPVGRLDWESEGALLLTNDGDLAHRLMHPSHHIGRVYEVKVKGEIVETGDTFKALKNGLKLEDGFFKPDRISVLSFTGKHTWLRFHIHEGRNRLLRRYCDAVGHPVLKLKRTHIGELELSQLPQASFRDLTQSEVFDLYEAVGVNPRQRPPQRAQQPRKEKGAAQRVKFRGGRPIESSKPPRKGGNKPAKTTPSKRRPREGGKNTLY